MRFKSGIDRIQDSFLPSCLDDYVDGEHFCRVISAFTESLNMSELGFKYANTKETGRKPFDPRMMLNLYIYGYLNRVRSSRRLEMEASRNIEVMWLLNKMVPDDRTIANFRKDNASALKKSFRAFIKMLKKLELFGAKVVALDGTKIRANNNNYLNYDKKSAQEALNKIDKKIADYMKLLDESDKENEIEVTPDKERLKKAIKILSTKKYKIEKILPKIETNGNVALIDTDARLMNQAGDSKGSGVSYNVQSVVDAENGLVVDFDVTSKSSDMGEGNLNTMSKKAKEALEVDEITLLADMGYYRGEEMVACEEEQNVTLIIPKPNRDSNKRDKSLDPNFAFEYFTYNKEKDCYICPMGQELSFRYINKYRNRHRRVYVNRKACHNCLYSSKCTTAECKSISREEYQDALDIIDERTRSNAELCRKRKAIVEHPFGTVKKIWGYSQFLCRTKSKVSAEMSLAFFAYNLRRVLTLFGTEIKSLIQKVQAM